MGQVSLPVLNRTGYSMFWQSVWDEKHNFNRGFKEDFLLRKLLPLFFYERLIRKKQFINYNVINNSLLLYDLDFWAAFKENRLLYGYFINSLKKKKSDPYYLLKIWIIKFQTWVILFFSLYVPFKKNLIIASDDSVFDVFSFLGYQFMFLSSIKFNKLYFNNTNYRFINF